MEIYYYITAIHNLTTNSYLFHEKVIGINEKNQCVSAFWVNVLSS